MREFLRPCDELDVRLAGRGYFLHPDPDAELWHLVFDGGVCVGVVAQPDQALRVLEDCGWPEAPFAGWVCPIHGGDAA